MLQQGKIGQTLVGSIVIHLWKGIQTPLFVISVKKITKGGINRAKKHLVESRVTLHLARKLHQMLSKSSRDIWLTKKVGPLIVVLVVVM